MEYNNAKTGGVKARVIFIGSKAPSDLSRAADDFIPASNNTNGEVGFTKHSTTLFYSLSDDSGVLYIPKKNGPYQFDYSFNQGYQPGCGVGKKPGQWQGNC
ncbi:hypothetical protein N7451_003040 [Penicillium sp. IBT 35674x]|nr:hypothetical protein N7451_003040 [Penicillium sp. IBT 35674x]